MSSGPLADEKQRLEVDINHLLVGQYRSFMFRSSQVLNYTIPLLLGHIY